MTESIQHLTGENEEIAVELAGRLGGGIPGLKFYVRSGEIVGVSDGMDHYLLQPDFELIWLESAEAEANFLGCEIFVLGGKNGTSKTL